MGKAQIVGLGKSGLAAARLLRQQGWQVRVSDRGQSESLQRQQQALIQEGIDVVLGWDFDPEGLSADDRQALELVVVSPGVPWDAPGLVKARDLGLAMVGEMGLAWQFLQDYPWVGITGTNGKTTTTALTAAIFAQAGLHAPACGNIGLAACEVAAAVLRPPTAKLAPQPLDWVIAEMSSYQIESGAAIQPKIGVWTTFTPDHLERHKTLENYYQIKAHLLNQSERVILNGDDPYLRQVAEQYPQAYWTSVKGKTALLGNPDQGIYLESGWVVAGGQRLVEAASLRMVGEHNLQNLLMSVAAAHLAGIEAEAIAAAVAQFPGVPHRLEHIRTWRGIDFINDSKATNYDAAVVGLSAVPAPAILIAGGEAKKGDDSDWLRTIQAKAAAVVLIGSAAPQFGRRLTEVGYGQHETQETIAQAVPRAAELAEQLGAKVVLLSPACASFDQYPNFEARGEDFRQVCLALD